MYRPTAPLLPAFRPIAQVGSSGALGFLGAAPTTTLTTFRGPEHTLEAMAENALGKYGEKSMLVRQFTEWVIREVQPKDYLGELLAIRNAFVQPSPWKPGVALFRYANDPRHVEMVKTPERMVREIMENGSCVCDCFPAGTLLLNDQHKLVRIEDVRAGDRIWGFDAWTEVKGTTAKGILPVTVIHLNNGSQVSLTEDHKVYVAICMDHGHSAHNKCSCRMDRRDVKRIHVSELVVGMVLLQPDHISAGVEEQDPRRAYVEGLYASDGWSSGTHFAISGQDGCPKEQQKREVERICGELGIETTWGRKSIRVLSKEWMDRIHRMGSHAPEKRVLSLGLRVDALSELLRGVLADSGRNSSGDGCTFTTTSRELMVQTRVMLRILGRSASVRHIVNHGGLGKNPIWRLGIREHQRREGMKGEKLLRVKAIDRNVLSVPCYDISTSDHYVYLPEHDVTVSNCDDYSCMAGTMCLQIGREVEFVAIGFEPGSLSHVGVRAKEPKSNTWIWLDGVAGPREHEAAKRAKNTLILKLKSLD